MEQRRRKVSLGSGGPGWGPEARFHGDLQGRRAGGLTTGKMMQPRSPAGSSRAV